MGLAEPASLSSAGTTAQETQSSRQVEHLEVDSIAYGVIAKPRMRLKRVNAVSKLMGPHISLPNEPLLDQF